MSSHSITWWVTSAFRSPDAIRLFGYETWSNLGSTCSAGSNSDRSRRAPLRATALLERWPVTVLATNAS